HRVLEDDGDFLAAERAQLVLAQLQEVAAGEVDLAAADIGIAGEQPEYRPEHGALARPALADDAEDPVLRDGEAHVAQRLDRPARRPEIDREPPYVDERLAHPRLSFGSKTSRSASPRKVKPSVVSTSGMPPAITGHGVSRISR